MSFNANTVCLRLSLWHCLWHCLWLWHCLCLWLWLCLCVNVNFNFNFNGLTTAFYKSTKAKSIGFTSNAVSNCCSSASAA